VRVIQYVDLIDTRGVRDLKDTGRKTGFTRDEGYVISQDEETGAFTVTHPEQRFKDEIRHIPITAVASWGTREHVEPRKVVPIEEARAAAPAPGPQLAKAAAPEPPKRKRGRPKGSKSRPARVPGKANDGRINVPLVVEQDVPADPDIQLSNPMGDPPLVQKSYRAAGTKPPAGFEGE